MRIKRCEHATFPTGFYDYIYFYFVVYLMMLPVSQDYITEILMFRVVFWDILPCKMIYPRTDDSEHHTRHRENLKFHTLEILSVTTGWT
jgi:hypothetical protein